MKKYQSYVQKTYGCRVTYLEFDYNLDDLFAKYKHKQIDMYDPVDHDIAKEFNSLSKKYDIVFSIHDTPLFLSTKKDLQEYLDEGGNFHQTSFYIWQRKRLNLLLQQNGKPIGGKWTYDTANRLPFPVGFDQEPQFSTINNKYVKEAQQYINKKFKDNPGETNLYIPIDHKGAKAHLKEFLQERLICFGPYQDAVSKDIVFGCHSVLSPLLNIGLITPKEVVDEIIEYYHNHKKMVPLSSVEALIRQIIGWREVVRLMYVFKHKEMIQENHFNHTRKLSKEWYTGKTQIEPIDDIIKKVIQYGYAHHIERLMYLGNFMLLNEFKPKDVYDWFMTLFIDAYPWVMEANIYAMSQYSTGPLLMTRPYFSASNYLNKMSTYKKRKNICQKVTLQGDAFEWYEVWDALYYNFVNNNRVEFSKNYATASAVSYWNKKNKSEKENLLAIAKRWFKSY
jgi:deoxyribodipyrimidine photolyase-related protein